MQNAQAPRKWTDLRGLAVVDLTNGKKLGTLDDFYFDPATSSIPALRVKTGLLSHKALPTTEIRSIGQDAVTITGEDALRADNADFSTFGRGQDLSDYKVMSASGSAVGTLGNVILETGTPAALRIASFELTGGLLTHIGGRYPTFAANQIVRYGQDVLVIPDDVAQTLK